MGKGTAECLTSRLSGGTQFERSSALTRSSAQHHRCICKDIILMNFSDVTGMAKEEEAMSGKVVWLIF